MGSPVGVDAREWWDPTVEGRHWGGGTCGLRVRRPTSPVPDEGEGWSEGGPCRGAPGLEGEHRIDGVDISFPVQLAKVPERKRGVRTRGRSQRRGIEALCVRGLTVETAPAGSLGSPARARRRG